jgi:hypothetical protein
LPPRWYRWLHRSLLLRCLCRSLVCH